MTTINNAARSLRRYHERELLRPKAPLVVDEGHLRRIRRLPCLICWKQPPSEAAHVRVSEFGWSTAHGAGRKPHDMHCLPLCVAHHRQGRDAEHNVGTVAFWRRFKMNPLPLAEELWEASFALNKAEDQRFDLMMSVMMRHHFLGELA